MPKKSYFQIVQSIADVQNDPAGVAVPLDRVGVHGLRLPLVVSDRVKCCQHTVVGDRVKCCQHTVVGVNMEVDLPAEFKGTSMSREECVEIAKDAGSYLVTLS